MPRDIYKLKIKVISVFNIDDFEGEVIPTFTNPNFVIALLIEDSEHLHKTDNPKISISVFDVVFYSIKSVSGLFGRSEVLGKSFTLEIEVENIDGQDWHFLSIA